MVFGFAQSACILKNGMRNIPVLEINTNKKMQMDGQAMES
jgi:hypothetical protein